MVCRKLPYIGAAGGAGGAAGAGEDRLLLVNGISSNGFWPVIG